jgi:hypothetical protein
VYVEIDVAHPRSGYVLRKVSVIDVVVPTTSFKKKPDESWVGFVVWRVDCSVVVRCRLLLEVLEGAAARVILRRVSLLTGC